MAKFALVKWLGGEDKGKYSPDVPVSWIRDFKEGDEEEFEESYIVEWRKGKNPPPGGWPVYDGLVICTASSVKTLEKKLENIGGLKSPRASLAAAADTADLVNQPTPSEIKRRRFANRFSSQVCYQA